jgi:long-chain fatty acid transport protein
MGMIRLAAGALLAIALLSSLVVASGFESTGLGWRARAMGGAFRAVADDWTAAYYNPAGYAWIKDNQAGGNSAFVHYRNAITPNYTLGGIVDSTGYFNGREINNRYQILSNPSAGMIVRMPVWGETVFGLSVYEPFDQNITWWLYRPIRAYNDTLDGAVPSNQFLNDLDVVAFQLTAAREFQKDKLSVGLGVQLLRADLVYNNVTLRRNPINDSGAVQTINYRPYDQVPELTSQNGNGWGFGLRAGALWKATPRLNVGFTAALPFDITIKGTAALSYLMPYIRSELRPGSTIFPGTVKYLFVAGQNLVVDGDFSTKLRLPPSLGVGFAYSANDRLTVDLDAEYTLWSRFKGFDFSYSNYTQLNGAMDSSSIKSWFVKNLSSPVKYKNALKLALGGNYELNKTVTLMAGGSYDQSANKDDQGVTPQFTDIGAKLGLSAGLTFHLQHWDLGLATCYTHYPNLTYSTQMDLDGDGVNDLIPGTYKAQTYETILSANYRF